MDTRSFASFGAFFGAAIVFASLAFIRVDSWLFVLIFILDLIGGMGLLLSGFWIERETFKIKREEQKLERVRLEHKTD